MAKEALAPILKVGNAAEAAAWYQRLGFNVELEHSTGPNLSRTHAVLTRGDLRLILSQGDDDVAPDSTVCLMVSELAPVAREFNVTVEKQFLRDQIDLRDPYGNRVRVVALDKVDL
jgi:uncharacterized glyoxalase superfamily protein PhnB